MGKETEIIAKAVVSVGKNTAKVQLCARNKTDMLNIYNAISNTVMEQLLEKGTCYDEAVGMLVNAATTGFETAYSGFEGD